MVYFIEKIQAVSLRTYLRIVTAQMMHRPSKDGTFNNVVHSSGVTQPAYERLTFY